MRSSSTPTPKESRVPAGCSPYQAEPAPTSLDYAALLEKVSADLHTPDSSNELAVAAQKMHRHKSNEPPLMQLRLSVKSQAKMNHQNSCNASGQGTPCIERWEFFAEDLSGSMQRILADQSSQNRAIEIPFASLICLSDRFSSRFLVVAKLNNGQTIVHSGNFSE